jgi:hypothetical protein
VNAPIGAIWRCSPRGREARVSRSQRLASQAGAANAAGGVALCAYHEFVGFQRDHE